jgi:hypothetical protein
MAEISKFFNSAPGDARTYQASDFADYFGSVLSTGLLHTDNIPALEVKCEGTDLRTYVTPGKAIIQGYFYENTSNLYLNHALPEPTLDRIDRIVLRLDKRNQSRFIKLFVKQGVPSSNPVPPDLQRDDFIYELSLAQIRVRANTSTLNPTDLIDERLDENLCGLVHSLISIPTSKFQAEWDAFMASVQDEGFTPRTEFDAHLADTAAHGIGDKSTLLTTNKNTIVEAINELFTFANDGKSSIAAVIGSPATSGDTFATLANHIQSVKNTMATNLTNKGTSASGTETLQSLADKIANVNTGKKWASGIGTTNASAGVVTVSVSGLSFKPSLVMFWAIKTDQIPYNPNWITGVGSAIYGPHYNTSDTGMRIAFTNFDVLGNKINYDNSGNHYLYQGGFWIKGRQGYGTVYNSDNFTYVWIAFE